MKQAVLCLATPRPRVGPETAHIDALEVAVGDVVSPLWTGVILVAANPRRVVPPP
jgi:hypothetical protein